MLTRTCLLLQHSALSVDVELSLRGAAPNERARRDATRLMELKGNSRGVHRLPSAFMSSFPPLLELTIQRAREADPNRGRCLVANCPKYRGVDAVHVLPRDYTNSSSLVSTFHPR